MQKIHDDVGSDEEMAHLRMDEVLCRVLTELGYGLGVAVFEEQGMFYS